MVLDRTTTRERAKVAERTTFAERAKITVSTNKGERASVSERTTVYERSWFDRWQARRVANRFNRKTFALMGQLNGLARRLERTNDGERAIDFDSTRKEERATEFESTNLPERPH